MARALLWLFLVFGASVVFQNVASASQESLSESLRRDQRSIHRVKREALTDSERDEVVSAHNKLRSLEGSSDMQTLRYSLALEGMAKAWAEQCQWYHNPSKSVPPETVGYKEAGENMFMASSPDPVNFTATTLDWFKEKSDYTYDTGYCPSTPGIMCGHYTQVVWADTFEIGCGYARCPTVNQSTYTNALLVVCNYGSPGNYPNTKPFKKGPACTQCGTGQFWCTQGLCNRACSTNPGSNCACSAPCQNGAVTDSTTCSCKCATGYTGIDCSNSCKNNDVQCGPPPGVPGWPPEWCNHPMMGEQVRQACPLMCGICKG